MIVGPRPLLICRPSYPLYPGTQLSRRLLWFAKIFSSLRRSNTDFDLTRSASKAFSEAFKENCHLRAPFENAAPALILLNFIYIICFLPILLISTVILI